MDFGQLLVNELESTNPTPLGYELCARGLDTRICSQELLIKVSPPSEMLPSSFKLASWRCLPTCDDAEFTVHLMGPNFSEAVGTNVGSMSFSAYDVVIYINADFHGYINRWLLLQFEGTRHYNSTSSASFSSIISLRINASVLSNQQQRLLSTLSAEARPFVPRQALEYFDSEVISFS